MKRILSVCLGIVLTVAAVQFAVLADAASAPPVSIARFTNASPAEVNAFVRKWNPVVKEQGFMVAASQIIIAETNTTVLLSKLLGALEREPSGVWVACLQIVASPDRPSTLPPGDLLAVWQQACALLEKAAAAAPNNLAGQDRLALARQSYIAACVQADNNLTDARIVAQRLLLSTPTNGWNYGNVVYDAHCVLGRIALRQADRPTARRELRAAGQTPGSPQLNTYGPHFVLARELLQGGDAEDRETVLAFLDDVAKFWADPDNVPDYRKADVRKKQQQIEDWKDAIRAGKIPAGGFNWR